MANLNGHIKTAKKGYQPKEIDSIYFIYCAIQKLEKNLFFEGKEGPTHLKDYVVDVLEKKHKVLQQIVSKESAESKAAIEEIEKNLHEMSIAIEDRLKVQKQTTDKVLKAEIPEFNKRLIDIEEKVEKLVKENSDLSKKNSRLCLATATMVCVCASAAFYFISLGLSAQADSNDPEEFSFLSFFKC